MFETPEQPKVMSRRQMLHGVTNGFGTLALAALLQQSASAATVRTPAAVDPLAAKMAHFAPKAKRAIFLFMTGGPSHVDLFDPKERLQRDNGKPLPFEKPKLIHSPTGNLLGSPFKFKKYGQAGTDVSELFP